MGLVVAGLVVLLAALAFGLRRFLRRDSSRTSAQLALEAWDRLLAKKLPENGRSERFITLLTMLMRRYLERQFALPARRRTTAEFVQQLESCPLLSGEEKQFLTSFLERCDAVKFAKVDMSVDECRRWADSARQFLQRQARG